jgi:hypothetical protein
LETNISFVDSETFTASRTLSREEYIDLHKNGLLPTRDPSENQIKQVKEDNEARDKRRKEKEIEEQERRKKDKELFTTAQSLDLTTQSDEIDQLIEQMSPDVCSIITGNIFSDTTEKLGEERKETIENISTFNVLSVSKHYNGRSEFHIRIPEGQVKLERNENNDLVFEYNYQNYKLINLRAGYDGSDLVLIGILSKKESKGRLGRETGSLELYTDLPFYKTIATPLEKRILSKKSYKALLIDDTKFIEDLRENVRKTRPVSF